MYLKGYIDLKYTHVYMFVHGVHAEDRRGHQIFLQLELQRIVNSYVAAGNQTPVLCKSKKCSSPLRSLSSSERTNLISKQTKSRQTKPTNTFLVLSSLFIFKETLLFVSLSKMLS